MNAFRLAFSLMMIPRLFASLLLFPLLISFCFVYFQLVMTGVAVRLINRDSKEVEQNLEHMQDQNILRTILYGSEGRLPSVRICRWVDEVQPDGTSEEVPPDELCEPDRLDLAIHTPAPTAFDVEPYRKLFDGNVERIHICKERCKPDIVIKKSGDRMQSDIYSVWGLGVMTLIMFNRDVGTHYVEAAKDMEEIKYLVGKRFLHSNGFRKPISLTGFNTSMILVVNISFLVVITLWLALKAHRKVLDYFVRNGALLPMVAACSKSSFYSAIWVITLTRVVLFLLGSVPVTFYTFINLLEDETKGLFGDLNWLDFALWIITIASSMSLATLIASIADLKHRHSIVSFVYRYIPISIAILGAAIWSASFVFDGVAAGYLRSMIAAFPIFGMTPVLVAPVFAPIPEIMALHTLATLAILAVALKHNTRWFAAHLEEL
jgi:hypothetical protein